MSLVEMIASGVVATLLLDLWQQLLRLTIGLPSTNWGMVGRWSAHLLRGKMFHDSIAAAAEVPNETRIGWIVHFAVGIVYGVVYVWVIRGMLGSEPSILNGLVFGAMSTVVPWFFFMPAMGVGRLAKNAPSPAKACLLAFLAHTVFGLGLAVGTFPVPP